MMAIDRGLWWGGMACAGLVAGIECGLLQVPSAQIAADVWEGLSMNTTTPQLLFFCMAPYIFHYLHAMIFNPFIYDHNLANGGHAPKNLQNRLKNSGAVPGPYPNGWFVVGLSSELERGEVRQVSVLGREFALYRGEDGKARVVDAFCAHLGANLAVDGKVEKDCLTCPFHGWSFEGESGQCVSISYSKSIPTNAAIDALPVKECNGAIYMWHHCNHAKPTWEVPAEEGIGSWKVRCDGFSRHEISCHVQEVPENGADVAHLNYLHTSPVVRFLEYFGITHQWSASWRPLTGMEAHVASIDLTQSLLFLGKWRVPGTLLEVSIKQHGPGVVILQFNTKIGKFYVVQSVTPLQPLLQSVIHSVYSPWYVPRVVGKVLLWSVVDQVERDIPIWNNKTYKPKPLLAKGDGRIGQFRRWFSQFYTEETREQARSKACILDW